MVPDVAVTVMVNVLTVGAVEAAGEGAAVLAWLVNPAEPVPHPLCDTTTTIAITASNTIFSCFLRLAAESVPNRPKTPAERENASIPPGLPPRGISAGEMSEAEVTEVVIVRAVLAGAVPATRGLLANTQLAPVGNPEQAKVIGDASCPVGVTVRA